MTLLNHDNNSHLEQNAYINKRLLSAYQIFENRQELGKDSTKELEYCFSLWRESSFYLSKIVFKNFRAFSKLELILDKRLTLIFGENGTGKTSILDAISKSLTILASAIKSPNINTVLAERDINIDAKFSDFCEIRSSLILKEKDELTCGLYKTVSGSTNPLKNDLRDFKKLGRVLTHINATQEALPVLVYYSVRRSEKMQVNSVLLGKRGLTRRNRIAELYDMSSLNSNLSLTNFEEWFTRLNRKQDKKSILERENFKKLIMETAPFIKDLRISINDDGDEILEVKIGDKFLNYSFLSDGQRVYLALILDLGQRLIISNPQSENPFNGKGIVLIDEIELHLHPQWQRDILPKLLDVFPNIQFIVTTHSPQVISSIDANYLRLLTLNENKLIEVTEVNYQTDGASSSEVLQRLMGVSLRRDSSPLVKKFQNFLMNCQDREYSEEALEALYQELLVQLNDDMLVDIKSAKIARDIKKRFSERIK